VEQRNALLAAGESIVRRAVIARQATVERLFQRLSDAAKSSSGPPRPIAFTLTPHYAEERPLQHQLARHRITSFPVDRHTSAGIPFRLQTLADQLEQGPIRILSDLFRETLACIPANVPVETWIPPFIGPVFWTTIPIKSIAAHDRIVVHSGAHRARLLALGVPEDRILIKPVPPMVATHYPLPSPLALRHRVALMADLPPSSMDALQLVLPTHQAVYAAARTILTDEYLSIHADSAPDLLRRASARAGLSAEQERDPTLRDPLLRMIRDCLIPAIPYIALAHRILDEGCALTIIGDWPDANLPQNDRVKRTSFAAVTADTWNDVAVLVHFSPEGIVSPLIWNAIVAHIPILAPEHSTDRLAGSLPTLLNTAAFVHPRPAHAITTLKGLLRDTAQRQRAAEAARACLEAALHADETSKNQ
jgi:hypothetical protein